MFRRFERERCNELWQTDFKGEFLTQDGQYCYPLDIIDDHSRFALRIAAADSTAQVVIPVFESAFREYGLPQAVLSDNGPQFAGFRGGYTCFEKWLMDLDVLPIHGRIGHPQTQGKIERFHRTMKHEFLRHHSFADAADAHAQLKNPEALIFLGFRAVSALLRRFGRVRTRRPSYQFSARISKWSLG